jgi:hypothetical protein
MNSHPDSGDRLESGSWVKPWRSTRPSAAVCKYINGSVTEWQSARLLTEGSPQGDGVSITPASATATKGQKMECRSGHGREDCTCPDEEKAATENRALVTVFLVCAALIGLAAVIWGVLP